VGHDLASVTFGDQISEGRPWPAHSAGRGARDVPPRTTPQRRRQPKLGPRRRSKPEASTRRPRSTWLSRSPGRHRGHRQAVAARRQPHLRKLGSQWVVGGLRPGLLVVGSALGGTWYRSARRITHLGRHRHRHRHRLRGRRQACLLRGRRLRRSCRIPFARRWGQPAVWSVW